MAGTAGNTQPLASSIQAGQFYSPTVAAPAPAAYSVIQPTGIARLCCAKRADSNAIYHRKLWFVDIQNLRLSVKALSNLER